MKYLPLIDFVQQKFNRISEKNIYINQCLDYTPSPFFYFLNNFKSFDFTEHEIFYLLEKSDLTHKIAGFTPLFISLRFNHTRGYNFSENIFEYIIKHSKLTEKTPLGTSILEYALKNIDSEKLNINLNSYQYLIDSCSSDIYDTKIKEKIYFIKNKLLENKISTNSQHIYHSHLNNQEKMIHNSKKHKI